MNLDEPRLVEARCTLKPGKGDGAVGTYTLETYDIIHRKNLSATSY